MEIQITGAANKGTNLALHRPNLFSFRHTMTFNRHICYLAGALVLCSVLSATDERESGGDTLQMPADQITVILRQTPMPDLGAGRLAKILARYYIEGLGGAENWNQISSLKVSGTLKLESGEFELHAYQKKPDLIKMTIRGNQRDLVLAYDGKTAWQNLPSRDTKPEPMAADEARRFMHSAHFGNHLLYPFAAGKKIEYIDTVPTEGSICHQIRVTLDSEYQVDYFIDIRTYLEIRVVNTDLRNQTTNSVVYKDYIREFGMPIAKQVESYENSEWVSSLKLAEVKVNAGVIPWMFKMRR